MPRVTEYPIARQILHKLEDNLGNDYHVSAKWHDDDRRFLDVEVQGPSVVPQEKIPIPRSQGYVTGKNLFGVYCTNFKIKV